MRVITVPGQVVMYVLINERTNEVIERCAVSTTEYPKSAARAKELFFHHRPKDDLSAVYVRLGGEPI